MGTRLAVGATPSDLLRFVVGSGLKMAGWGAGIGGAVSVAAVWLLVRNFEIAVGNGGEGRLAAPGVTPFLAATLLVGLVSAGSSLFPAWWAALLPPMVAIRDDPSPAATLLWSSPRADTEEADPDLVTGLIGASRGASSHREALRTALEALRVHMGASSAVLMESASRPDFVTTAATPESSASCSIPSQGLLASRLRTYHSPLPIDADDFDALHRWAEQFKPTRLPEIEALAKTGARLAVALRTNHEILGLLLLGPPIQGETYGPSKRRVLGTAADQFALMTENARLTDRVLAEEKLRRDLALAAEVQSRLLARRSLETPAISTAVISIPARSVGGDYFDLIELESGRTAIADVAGKGAPAALIMSAVQAMLRVLSALAAIAPSALAADMNRHLYRSTGSSSYATFFYAEVDGGTLHYVNAGHNPPYLLRADDPDSIEELSIGGTVIGLFPQSRYEEGAVELQSGDLLVAFTDGVPEALNPGEEEFGEDRLKSLAQQMRRRPVEEIVAGLARELKHWIQDAAQYDDLTVVVVKMK